MKNIFLLFSFIDSFVTKKAHSRKLNPLLFLNSVKNTTNGRVYIDKVYFEVKTKSTCILHFINHQVILKLNIYFDIEKRVQMIFSYIGITIYKYHLGLKPPYNCDVSPM
ncbi:hypothetical protein HHI36_003807 [Cryptolaemus montrouzieri]|uniref:Uncharacterized protein n=1 Tax=Cryptolaemus montrouzieri TaxID=559131 RepID=A0ABD2NPN8_9CUCU